MENAIWRDGTLEANGGPAYLASLIDGVSRSANVRYYAQIVAETARRRRAIQQADQFITSALSDNGVLEAAVRVTAALQDLNNPIAETADLAARLREPETPPDAAIDGLIEFGAASLSIAAPTGVPPPALVI